MRRLYVLLLLQVLVIIGLVVLLQVAPKPFPTSLIRWDAVWYDSIRLRGYFYSATGRSSVAFFPLFPLLWRATHLGPIGISLFNLALSGGSIYMLYRGLRLRPIVVVLFAAFPSSMFLYMPYTEALYFFFTSLVLLLLDQQYRRPVSLAVALVGAAFTRVATFFYLPALVIMEGVEGLQKPGTWWARLRLLLGYGLVVGAGLAGVMVYQWTQTGVWFAFNKAEAHWNHRIRVPQLPFAGSASNDGVLWLDGLALLVGLSALLWVGWVVVRVARRQGPAPDRLLVFAATYVAANTLQTLVHAPYLDGHSQLMSLHRYIFCTPFFLVLLEKLVPQRPLAWRTVALALAAVLATTAVLGMLSTKQFIVQWPAKKIMFLLGPVPGVVYALFVLAYSLLWLQTGTRWGRALVYLGNFAIQVYFFYIFTVGHWIA